MLSLSEEANSLYEPVPPLKIPTIVNANGNVYNGTTVLYSSASTTSP